VSLNLEVPYNQAAGLYLPLTGGALTGPLALGANKITGLANGTAATDAATFGQVLTKKATTGATGYTLINGTGTILTWTAPGDGALHTVYIAASLRVTVLEVGGQISVVPTDTVAGVGYSPVIFNPAKGIGWFIMTDGAVFAVLVPGDTIAIAQTSALTSGASVLFAEIWSS
jgi:hypothetical protein